MNRLRRVDKALLNASCSAHDCGGKQQFGQMVGHGGEELQTFAGVGADNDFAHLGIVDGIVDPE